MMVAAGSGLPVEMVLIDGAVSSVIVRFGPLNEVGRNSATFPVTITASPTFTVGALLVNTKIASDVATSASADGSWM